MLPHCQVFELGEKRPPSTRPRSKQGGSRRGLWSRRERLGGSTHGMTPPVCQTPSCRHNWGGINTGETALVVEDNPTTERLDGTVQYITPRGDDEPLLSSLRRIRMHPFVVETAKQNHVRQGVPAVASTHPMMNVVSIERSTPPTTLMIAFPDSLPCRGRDRRRLTHRTTLFAAYPSGVTLIFLSRSN